MKSLETVIYLRMDCDINTIPLKHLFKSFLWFVWGMKMFSGSYINLLRKALEGEGDKTKHYSA